MTLSPSIHQWRRRNTTPTANTDSLTSITTSEEDSSGFDLNYRNPDLNLDINFEFPSTSTSSNPTTPLDQVQNLVLDPPNQGHSAALNNNPSEVTGAVTTNVDVGLRLGQFALSHPVNEVARQTVILPHNNGVRVHSIVDYVSDTHSSRSLSSSLPQQQPGILAPSGAATTTVVNAELLKPPLSSAPYATESLLFQRERLRVQNHQICLPNSSTRPPASSNAVVNPINNHLPGTNSNHHRETSFPKRFWFDPLDKRNQERYEVAKHIFLEPSPLQMYVPPPPSDRNGKEKILARGTNPNQEGARVSSLNPGNKVRFSRNINARYDGQTHSHPYRKYGPYKRVFDTSQKFAAYTRVHYTREANFESRRRLAARFKNKVKGLQLMKTPDGITILPTRLTQIKQLARGRVWVRRGRKPAEAVGTDNRKGKEVMVADQGEASASKDGRDGASATYNRVNDGEMYDVKIQYASTMSAAMKKL